MAWLHDLRGRRFALGKRAVESLIDPRRRAILIAEIMKMNSTLHVQMTGLGRTTANPETLTTAADAALWRSAVEVLRERVYVTPTGAVRVSVDWRSFLDRDEDDDLVADDLIAIEVNVADERQKADPRDAVSFVELFFHDVFLLLNLAVPGSFGGAIVILAGGEHRASEVALSARLFEYAWATASRNGKPSIEPLPLADVVRWYDALQMGTQQLAATDVTKALFLLLHLARAEENESTSVLLLGQALEALSEAAPRFFEVRDAIAHGTAPVLHPMADDALDDRVDDASIELVNAADLAASVVVSAIQERVRLA
jgi:hypothetical protein